MKHAQVFEMLKAEAEHRLIWLTSHNLSEFFEVSDQVYRVISSTLVICESLYKAFV